MTPMGTMDRRQLERIADDYQSSDTSEDLDRAAYDDTVVAEPMVTHRCGFPRR